MISVPKQPICPINGKPFAESSPFSFVVEWFTCVKNLDQIAKDVLLHPYRQVENPIKLSSLKTLNYENIYPGMYPIV